VKAGTVLFCGLGDAAVVAQEAHQRFVRVGKRCVSTLDPDLQLMYASQFGPGDVVVAISHSGRSRTVLDTVRMAKDRGVTVIGITNFPVSPLAKKADIVLLTAVFTEHITGEVGAKRATELSILESLSINYAIKIGDEAISQLQRSNKSVDVNKI
jgi:DNA-binding MurR/RpiR family transcriptional regulator